MATIDRFVIEASIDPTKVGVGLRKALVDLDKFMADAERKMRASALNPMAGLAGRFRTAGVPEAQSMVANLNKAFAAASLQNRGDFAKNLINEKEFQLRGIQAAEKFNEGLTAGTAALQSQFRLSSNAQNAILSQYKVLGRTSAQFFNDEFNARTQTIQRVGAGLSSTGSALTKSITLPIIGIGTAMALSAAKFQKGMNEVRANTGATATEFDALQKSARELGQSEFGATTISAGMAELARAGYDTNQIIKGMPAIMNLATAGQLDLAEAAQVTTNVLRSQQFQVTEAGRVTDVLTEAAIKAQTDVRDLAVAFKYVGAVGAATGLQFENVVATLEALSQAGFTASFAGTAMRGSLTRLLDPTSKAAKIFDRLKIHITDAKGNLINFSSIIQQFEEKGIKPAEVLAAFGQRAGPGLASLLTIGSKALQDFEVDLQNAQGKAAQVRFIQLQGAVGETLRLKAAFQELSIAIGDSGFLNVLTTVIHGISGLITKLSTVNPNILTFIGSFALAVATVGPFLLAMGSVLKLIATLRTALIALEIAATPLEVTLGVIGAVAIGVGALTALIYHFAKGARQGAVDTAAFSQSLAGMNTSALQAADTEQFLLLASLKKQRDALGASGTHEGANRFGEPVITHSKEYNRLTTAIDEAFNHLTILNKAVGTSITLDKDKANSLKELTDFQKKLQDIVDGTDPFSKTNTGKGAHVDTAGEAFAKQVQTQVGLFQALNTLGQDTTVIEQRLADLTAEGAANVGKLRDNADEALNYYQALAQIHTTLTKPIVSPFEKQARDIAQVLRAKVATNTVDVSPIIDQITTLMDQIQAAMDDADLAGNTEAMANFANAMNIAQKDLDAAIKQLHKHAAGVFVYSEGNLPPSASFGSDAGGEREKRDIELQRSAYDLKHSFTDLGTIMDVFQLDIKASILDLLSQIPTPAEAMVGAIKLVTTNLFAFRRGVSDILGAINSAVNPINFFSSIFEQVASALTPTFDALKRPLELFANIMNNTLTPVLKAIAPFLEQLFVPLQAILNVITPILVAMAPLIQVVVDLLKLAFPIIKFVAIAFTYVAQVAFTLIGAFLKVVSWFETGIGWLIRAIGKAVNFLLPGNPANGLVRFGQGMIDAGNAINDTANAFFDSAHDMVAARKQIEGVNLADTLAQTADAAQQAAENLQNVPDGYKLLLNLRRFDAAQAVNAGGTPTRGFVPSSSTGASLVVPPSTGNSGVAAPVAVAPNVVITVGAGAIVISADGKDSRELADEVLGDLQRRAKLILGDATKWSQVQS